MSSLAYAYDMNCLGYYNNALSQKVPPPPKYHSISFVITGIYANDLNCLGYYNNALSQKVPHLDIIPSSFLYSMSYVLFTDI